MPKMPHLRKLDKLSNKVLKLKDLIEAKGWEGFQSININFMAKENYHFFQKVTLTFPESSFDEFSPQMNSCLIGFYKTFLEGIENLSIQIYSILFL